jgi:hypothetical protein
VEVLEAALVKSLTMLACPPEPARDRRLAVAKDPHGCRDVESLGQGGEDFGNSLRRCLESVQRSMAARGERVATGLAAEGLDSLGLAVGAVANQGVELRVGDTEVDTARPAAGETLSVDLLRGTATALDLGPGTDRPRLWLLQSGRELLLATLRAVIGSPGLEKSLEGGLGGSRLGLGRPKGAPDPDEPEQPNDEHEQEEAQVGHRRSSWHGLSAKMA